VPRTPLGDDAALLIAALTRTPVAAGKQATTANATIGGDAGAPYCA